MSPNFYRILPVLLSFLLVSLAHGNDLPDKVNLSLKSAMAMAIRNNLDLRVDALDSSMAEANLHRSRGLYNPYLSLSANRGQTYYTGETYGINDTTTAFSLTQYLPSGGSLSASTQTGYSTPASDFPDDDWTDWYTSVGLSVSQPLLKYFGKEATELNISLAAYDHEDSIERFRLSVIDTVYAVIKAYNRLYRLRVDLISRQQALDSARQLLERIKQQDKTGEQQGVSLANAEYAISQRLKESVDAETKIKDQEADLRYLIGVEAKATLVPVDPPSREEPMETEAQAISLALEHRSELKQLRLELKSSALQQRVAKRNLLPNLSINAGAGFRGIEDKFSDSVEQIRDGKGRWWTAGLQFSVPLGNTVAKNDYRHNRLRTRQIKNQLAALEWKLRDAIEEDMRELISARIQRQVADKAVKAAKQRLAQYRQSLKNNTSKVQDLLNAENDLVNAQNNQTEALEDFANAVALLWMDAGVLLERLNIHFDTSQPEKLTDGTEPISYPVSSPVPLAQKKVIETTAPLPKSDKATMPPAATASSATDSEAQSSQAAKLPPEEVAITVPETQSKPLPAEQADNLAGSGLYTLKIGEYASSELAATQNKVISAGLLPRVSAGSKQPRQVIRLNAGDYLTQADAQKELDRLHAANGGGFILNRGKAGYRLYAGSFFSQNSAQKEQQRLAALGLKLTLEESTVMLPTSLLTAGRFTTREDALESANKLESLGVESVVEKMTE